jgi:hypothetical protein
MSKPTKRDLEQMRDLAVDVVDRQQARLDAIAAIAGRLCRGPMLEEPVFEMIEILARGTPAREVRAALKRYGRKAK